MILSQHVDGYTATIEFMAPLTSDGPVEEDRGYQQTILLSVAARRIANTSFRFTTQSPKPANFTNLRPMSRVFVSSDGHEAMIAGAMQHVRDLFVGQNFVGHIGRQILQIKFGPGISRDLHIARRQTT